MAITSVGPTRIAVAGFNCRCVLIPVGATRMVDDEVALLQAIKDAPWDHAPVLVYCDWLQEHGQDDLANDLRRLCTWSKARHEYLGGRRKFNDVPPHPADGNGCKSYSQLLDHYLQRAGKAWTLNPKNDGRYEGLGT